MTVVADRDDAGRKHAKEVAGSLQGVAASVRVVEPAVGKDATEHLAAEKTLDEFVPIAAPASSAEAEPFTLTIRTPREICNLPDPDDGDQLLGPILIRGYRTIIGAHTGEGKSTITTRMLAAFPSTVSRSSTGLAPAAKCSCSTSNRASAP